MWLLGRFVWWLKGFFEDQELGKKVGLDVQSMKRLVILVGALGGYQMLRMNLVEKGISKEWVDAFQVWIVSCSGVYVLGLGAAALNKKEKPDVPPPTE